MLNMTFSANSNNIKQMFWFVAVPVMILLGGFRTIMAQQSIWAGQLAINNSLIYGLNGLLIFWMTNRKAPESIFSFFAFSISFHCTFEFFCFAKSFLSNSAFIAFLIMFFCRFTFFAPAIFFCTFQMAYFALASISILMFWMFVKFRKLFDLLAFRALFCLNCLSHNRLLYRRLRLEPVAVHTTAVGSLYYYTTLKR